jgi:hypothetical protein
MHLHQHCFLRCRAAGYAGVQRTYAQQEKPAALCAGSAADPQKVPQPAVTSNV